MIDERLWILLSLFNSVITTFGILLFRWIDRRLTETETTVKWYNGQMDLMKRRGIYTILCAAENATYLGSTEVNFHMRWGQHITQLERNEHHNARLQAAWNEHGAGAFHFYVTETMDGAIGIQERETEMLEWRAMNLPAKENYNVLNSRMRRDIPLPQLQFIYPTRVIREAAPAPTSAPQVIEARPTPVWATVPPVVRPEDFTAPDPKAACGTFIGCLGR